jgi:membrane protein implicated in regulation of membrane protease activity
MSAEYWWVWMIIAAVFAVAEILTAGFFLLWFGVGAAVAGLLALVGLGLIWQLSAFVVVSLGLFAVSRRFADRFSKAQPPGVGADRFVGRMGVVIERIDGKNNTGRVRFESEEWRAESDNAETVDVGVAVEAVRVVGTRVIVKVINRS